MKNKNCLIAAVGKNSLHRNWMGNNMSFDLHLIIYDDSYELFKSDTGFISQSKGYKLKLVYEYLKKYPHYIDEYEYIFIPDDDIMMNSRDINKLFLMMKKYSLEIAQPALIDSYYTYEHTLKHPLCLLRYTNFIEMMIPCFSRKAIKAVLETFNANNSGWGIEWHWSIIINSNKRDMAIIDDIGVVHTRPITTNRTENFKEYHSYIAKYNLLTKYDIYEKIIDKKKTTTISISKYEELLTSANKIADFLSYLLINKKLKTNNLYGVLGSILYLFEIYKLTSKKVYYDIAVSHLSSYYSQIDISNHNSLFDLYYFLVYAINNGYLSIDGETDVLNIMLQLIKSNIQHNKYDSKRLALFQNSKAKKRMMASIPRSLSNSEILYLNSMNVEKLNKRKIIVIGMKIMSILTLNTRFDDYFGGFY